jgi:formylglycine-generating enzyme required for sulfatase activity
MPKVFISYGRDESHGQNLATEIQDQLQAAGFDVFRDATGLKGGDFWLQKLEKSLRASDVVVLVLSEKVLHSKWVPNEINLAEELEIPVIPLFAEFIQLPLWLRHLQVLNFSTEVNWQLLFDAINNHLGSSPEEGVPTIREIVDLPDKLLGSVTSKNGIPTAPPGPFNVPDSFYEKPMHSVIIRAREAFWDNRLDAAVELYATLIEREPTVTDYKGELGNIFWRQGLPEKAAELYADISFPMIEKGNGERVSEMVGVIGLFYPDSAADIRKLLVTNSVKKSRTVNVEVRRKKTILRKKPDTQLREQLLTLHWSNNTGQDQYGQYADFQFNNVTQRFRLIKPGTFWMGSPSSEAGRYEDREARHQVTLTKPFWLADTTVTQALWLSVLDNNPSHFANDLNNPVENVSWNDAQEFIQTLNNQIGGSAARLPTEAQWEYACRAGTNTPFSFGSQITPEQVNYHGEYPYANGKKGLFREVTVPVKSLPVNPWGLYEMHGNVWEWCNDSWLAGLGSESVTDPENDEAGARRVIRGGSWDNRGGSARSASRFHFSPDYRGSNLGLRLSFGHPSASSGGGSR